MSNLFEDYEPAGPPKWGDLPEHERRMHLMRQKYGEDAESRAKSAAQRIREEQQAQRDSTTKWFQKRGRPVDQAVLSANVQQEADLGWSSALGVEVPDYRLQMRYGNQAYPSASPPQKPDKLSLGDQVGRWYANTGGLQAAVSASQKAQRVNDANKLLDRDIWPQVTPEAVSRQFPVQYGTPHRAGVHGTFNFDDNTVRTAGENPASYILDHELTHGATAADGRGKTVRAAGKDPSRSWNPAVSGERQEYLTDPTEVDARLADVKRRYAHYTGRLVDSPEEAKKAWEWWRENEGEVAPSRGAGTSIGSEAFDLYDKMPDRQREQLFLRMPELVRSEDRIRGLRRA